MLSYILFVFGIVILVKGADILVDGAASIARRYNISDLVIGLTIVAFGTSTPELFVNVAASLKGNADIAIGNVIGSSIANILLILGISSAIYPLTATKGTVWKEIPFSFMAAIMLAVMTNDRLIDKFDFSAVTRSDGLAFLGFFVIFMYYSFGIAKKTESDEKNVSEEKPHGLLKSIIFIILGLIGLGLGGKWIVDGAIFIALQFGMSQSLVGLTIVAIGTSLPELATSAMAAYKKNVGIAVGSVVGSNIFNIFFVLGISSLIKPLPFRPADNLSTGVVILANIMLFATMFTGRKRVLERWEGFVFLTVYAGYITFLVINN
ncbi:calcium/sodium antiporter [Desulfobacterales bacterium HSG16]|nr:calcium/sodium antiporter [Desulfobacterales bacterium HSG16]